jgi:xanthosine phosphorylase
MQLPLRALKSAGCEMVVLTCAAGSLNPGMPPGHLMCVTDHINWSGLSPLIGPNDDDVGPRFLDLTEAYDSHLQSLLKQAAADSHVDWHEGVYLWSQGPNFETPAEIRAFQSLGVDAVGMSTVPECLIARHCGLRVVALAVITNFAAGLDSEVLSHEGTLASGQQAVPDMVRLLDRFFTLLNDTEVTGCWRG